MRTAIVLALSLVFLSAWAAGTFATEPFAVVPIYTSTIPDYARAVRNQALGATGVADPSRPANAVYNPANLLGRDGVSAFYQHDSYLNFATVHDAGLSYTRTVADGTFQYAIGVRHLHQNYQPEIDRIVFLPHGTGRPYDPDDSFTTVTLAAGMNAGVWRVALGSNVKRINLTFAAEEVIGWAFDLGFRTDWTLTSDDGESVVLHLGASAVGFEHGFDFDGRDIEVEDQLRLGAGVEYATSVTVSRPVSGREVPAVSIATNIDYVRRNRRYTDDNGLGMGIELGIAETVYLRVGGVDNMPAHADAGTWGVGTAFDFGLVTIRLDLASYDLDRYSLVSDDDLIWGVSVDYSPQ